jgi:hypothetical protein
MKMKTWVVDGVHAGKNISDLPITYLLWFVGSPIMRRHYWTDCKVALIEIQNRLAKSLPGVEAELIEDLRPRSRLELLVIRKRKQAFLSRRVKDQALEGSPGT